MENNQLQNLGIYLPGDLGSVTIKSSGASQAITSAIKNKDGSVTLTLSPNKRELPATAEDIDHEVVLPKLIENEKTL